MSLSRSEPASWTALQLAGSEAPKPHIVLRAHLGSAVRSSGDPRQTRTRSNELVQIGTSELDCTPTRWFRSAEAIYCASCAFRFGSPLFRRSKADANSVK